MSVIWTWPLAFHLRDHIAGPAGANYSFLWNLWWMRKAISAPELEFFRSTYLFHPVGVDLIMQPNMALHSYVSATLLGRLTIVEAENLYIIASVFLNAACAYALAFDAVRNRRVAVLAAFTFGGSPFIAARLLGHFHLLSAWVIPLFALFFRRSLRGGSVAAAAGAGACVSIAAYSAYDHVLYLALFALTYTIVSAQARESYWRAAQALMIVVATSMVLCLPLIVQAFRVAFSGYGVMLPVFWRGVPRGVDLVAPFLGNPFHPLYGGMVSALYDALRLDRIEGFGWVGLVPLFVLMYGRGTWLDAEEAWRWKFVLVVSAILSCSMRAMAGVYLSLGMLIALRLAGLKASTTTVRPEASTTTVRPEASTATVGLNTRTTVRQATTGRTSAVRTPLGRPAVQWALVGLLAFDYLYLPIPLTALDRHAVYEQLASIQDAGAVVEVPLSIGDGRPLHHATIHGHPVVGGYLDRMPPMLARAYALMPVVGNLVRLSNGDDAIEEPPAAMVPFRYLVLDTEAASPELIDHVRSTLDMDLIASSSDKQLYAVQGVRPANLRASR